MPSAIELFYIRRSRPIRDDPLTEELDSSPHRNLHHHSSGRRHHQTQRHDDAGGFPIRHGSSRALPFHERSDQHEEDTGGANGERLRSSRRLALSPSGRLPRAVVLARARLLERLRGLENGQSGRASPPTNYSGHTLGVEDEFGLVDASNWDTNNSSSDRSASFADFISEAQRVAYLPEKYRKPPGLTKEAVESLRIEIFSRTQNEINGKNLPGGSGDCSICLENFVEGDKLVCLPCVHRFHSSCLDPWVRTCGACPYCRRAVV